MIVMQAPSGYMKFGLSNGNTYVSDAAGLIKIISNSVADQLLLQQAGCLTLSVTVSGTDEYIPSTGFSHTIADNVTALLLKPAGTLATGTITMPASPYLGLEVAIASRKTVTALTHNANTGQTITGALTTISANGFGRWRFVSDSNWDRVG